MPSPEQSIQKKDYSHEKLESEISYEAEKTHEAEKSKVDKESNLPFTSAVITYIYEGAKTGKETAYIDLKANKIAVETFVSVTFKGKIDNDHTLNIYDGEVAYGVHFGRKQAIKAVKKGDILAEIFGEERYLDYYTKEASFLGKTCKVYQSPQGTVYFWQGISLKEEITVPLIGLKYTKEAINIELNTPISREKFKLPAGVKVTTTEKLMKDFEKKFKNLRK